MKGGNTSQKGWNFARQFLEAQSGSQPGAQYIGRIKQSIEDLTEQINSKDGFLTDPSRLKGFVAEDWHAGTFNIKATLADSPHQAVVVGSNEHASVDVSTNFGQDYSLKYYATGRDSAISQAKDVFQAYYRYRSETKSENPLSFEEYLTKNGYSNDTAELLQSVYHGQGRIIPGDQLEEAIKTLRQLIATESQKGGVNRAAVLAKYEETLSRLSDRIQDGNGVESIPLTKDEAEAIAALCKEGKFNPADFGLSLEKLVSYEFILQQALKAGCTAAVLTLVFQLAPHIYNAFVKLVQEGEIDVDELKGNGLQALSSSAEGFLRGAVASVLTVSAQSGQLGEALKMLDAGIIGAMTFLVLSTMKDCILLAAGKITQRELEAHLLQGVVVSVVSMAMGAIGQTLLPALPVLGYMLGSFVGSLVVSCLILPGEKYLLAYCVRSGFTCFGFVEQNYTLPPELLKEIGYEIVDFERIDFERIDFERIDFERIDFERIQLPSQSTFCRFEFKPLRRGVIGVNQIGFV